MRKAVYIPIMQYTSNRHQTFLECLCRHFTVIISKLSPIELRSNNIEWVEDILTEKVACQRDAITVSDFENEYAQLCLFAKERLRIILPNDLHDKTVGDEFSQYRTELQTIYKEAIQLLELSRRRKVDFVIASCDYAYLSRPAVHMAKLLGIHTVDVEHGYFGMQLYPSAWEPPATLQRGVADTVILDNDLEALLFKENRNPGSSQQYLPLGTPMDHAFRESKLSKKDAFKMLQLNENRKTVVLALSWSIPFNLDGLLATHRHEVAFVDSVLSVLSNNGKYEQLQVILKLHPAIKNFKEDSHVIRFYKSRLKKFKMENRSIVTVTNMNDVFPCADVVIGWTMSSVLFDAAMEGIPAANYIATKELNNFKEDPNRHSEMAKADLIKILLSEEDLEEYLDLILANTYRDLYQKRKDEFIKKWHINRQSVEQKSMNIVNWLQNFSN